jgi:hypothetical protein
MDKEYLQLKKQIEEIEALKTATPWGAEYKLWNTITEKCVKHIFGDEGLTLFQKQRSVALDDEAYIYELTERKKLLDGLLAKKEVYRKVVRRRERGAWRDSGAPETILSVIFGIFYFVWRFFYIIFSFIGKFLMDILRAAYKKVVEHFGTLLALIIIGIIIYLFSTFIRK